MLAAGSLVVGLGLYRLFSFSAAQIVILFVAIVIAAFLSRNQYSIPQTKITIDAKNLIVFWGIIWLGVPGGVLLAAGIAAARYNSAEKNKRHWLLGGLADTIAAFAAGNVFYYVLKNITAFEKNVVAENALTIFSLIAAMLCAGFAHYLLSGALKSIFYKLENSRGFSQQWKENFLCSLINYALGIGTVFVLHLAFLEFGLYFGLVILPTTVFGHFAYRLHVSRFEQKTREITEASRIHLATVEALATAIDARDQVGVGHVRRTQIYAVGIGELLGLSTADLQALNTGALLHDIGKLAVPDHILNKPGRLTAAEMEKTKIHATVGASILEKVNFPYPVVPTVKHHHEKWDGSGYPEGLKGENIPLTARILTIADAYDTLRGARPYRPAISRDDVRRYLLNGAGLQFDPKIVDLFLRNLKKFEAEVEAQGFSYTFDKDSLSQLHSSFEVNADQNYVEQIKSANREVFTLYELARVFSSSLHLHETLALFAKKIGELVPFDTCIIYLLDETEEFAKAAYVEGENSSVLKNNRIKPGEGATGYVLKKRKAVHNVEPGLDFTFRELDLHSDYSAMASLPLVADDKLLGAVSLYSYELTEYEEEHMRLLETVARIASDALGMALQHAESESRALTDPMTDLPNARSLQAQFEKETARADRNGSNFQLLMLDLDGFKAVNDTFGHKAGDKLLKELARIMKAQLRDYDFLARYAGDEFVAIVPETDAAGIYDLCCRIEKAVDEFVLPLGDGKNARVGISIGTGCYPHHGSTLDQIIIHADKAMYSVKAERKRSQLKQVIAAAEPEIRQISSDAILNNELVPEENYIVELDESHIVSSALN